MYTLDDEMREMLEKFLAHGIDVSRFKFKDDVDKDHFFTMYEDYMQIFAQQAEADIEVLIERTSTKDVNVFIEGKEVCHVYFNNDLSIIQMNTYETLENPVLVFCIKVLLGTVRELGQIVNNFASMLNKLTGEVQKQEEMEEANSPNSSLYKAVPKDVYESINKVQKIQKSILDDKKKYKIDTKGVKDD